MRPRPYLLLFLSILWSAAPCAAQGGGASNLAPVDLYRDANRWPHVFGTTDAAAWYAFGRAQMADLPISTAVNLAAASGELAAHLGTGPTSPGSPGVYVEADLRTRLWRIPHRALVHESALEPWARALLVAWVAGVNDARAIWLANAAQLANATEPIALDLVTVQRLMSRPITLLDVLAHGIQMNGNTSMFEARALAFDPEETYEQDPIRTASNGWIIGASATVGGRPLLLADPHIGLQNSPQYRAYFAQISGPGAGVCGITFPGWPCIAIGYNADIAWAVTSNNPDIVDVYKAPKLDPDHFPLDGRAASIVTVPAPILVFDPGANATYVHQGTARYAAHLDRPVIREGLDKNGVDSVWYAAASFTSAPCLWTFFLELGQATGVPAALQAMSRNAITSSNFLVTDRFDNRGYLWAGRVPIRGAPTPGTSWREVQDGTKSAYHWHFVHPVADLPLELELSPGIVSSDESAAEAAAWIQCNVLPDRVRPVPTIDLEDYPDDMVPSRVTPSTFRQDRAEELLRPAGTVLDPAEGETIAVDALDLWWRALEPVTNFLLVDCKLAARNPAAAGVVTRLQAWNGIAARDSAEAVLPHLVHAFYAHFVRKHAELGNFLMSEEPFDDPDEIPDAAELAIAAHRWANNLDAFEMALQAAAVVHPLLVNRLLPGYGNPASPWTPFPWAGLSTTEAVLGEILYLDLTPATNPQHLAVWPVGAAPYSLFTAESARYEHPYDALLWSFGLLGETGPFLAKPLEAGSHTLLQVELGSPPRARYLEALGPSELAADPLRYQGAQDFVDGVFRDFPCSLPEVLAEAVEALQWQYADQSSVETGDDG